MSEPLTAAELARMRADHFTDRVLAFGRCCYCLSPWPCDAARLIAHFSPGPVPHLAEINADHCHCGAVGMATTHPKHAPTSEQQAEIGMGLLGPRLASELAAKGGT